MSKITLKQCKYFVAVAEQGGIAQASRVLNISQPAVAQALDKLEQRFDFRLFERHHARGTDLTPQGRSFLNSARNLLKVAEYTENDAKAIAANTAGIIRLGCFHSIAAFYLPQIISAYNRVYPSIEIASSELRQDEITNCIDSGEIDLALTYDMSLQEIPVERQIMAELKPVILLSEHHHLARQSSIRLADMAEEPFVLFEGPSSREYFENVLATQGIDPPVCYHSKSMESVSSAVANGLGFSLAVMKVEQSNIYGGGRVISIPIEEKVDSLAIVLIRKQGLSLSAQLEQFSDYIWRFFNQT